MEITDDCIKFSLSRHLCAGWLSSSCVSKLLKEKYGVWFTFGIAFIMILTGRKKKTLYAMRATFATSTAAKCCDTCREISAAVEEAEGLQAIPCLSVREAARVLAAERKGNASRPRLMMEILTICSLRDTEILNGAVRLHAVEDTGCGRCFRRCAQTGIGFSKPGRRLKEAP